MSFLSGWPVLPSWKVSGCPKGREDARTQGLGDSLNPNGTDATERE